MIASKFKENYLNGDGASARAIALLGLASLYAVMWVGGVSSYLFEGGPPPGSEWAAPSFLFLAGLVILVAEGRRGLPVMLAVAAAGFAVEVIGARYGFIFGEYRYTQVLAPSLLGVPVAMASAWLVLVAYARRMLSGFRLKAWAEASLGALWMTAIDLVIEPLASGRLNYWRWEDAGAYYGIPAHNFIGWLAVSLLIFLLVRTFARRGWRPGRWASIIGFSIVLFFTLIALSAHLFLASGIGLALCVIHVSISIGPAAGTNKD